MDFSEALKRLKSGRMLRRSGWVNKGMHVYLEDSLTFTLGGGVYAGQTRKYKPFLVLFDAQGQHQPGWVCSQADLLAEDWAEVDR